MSREGECLTAYTCFKRTVLSIESTPSGVNQISTPKSKHFYILLSKCTRNCVFDNIIIDINDVA